MLLNCGGSLAVCRQGATIKPACSKRSRELTPIQSLLNPREHVPKGIVVPAFFGEPQMQASTVAAISGFKFPVFVQPPRETSNGQPSVIDSVVLNADGVQVGEFSRETLEEVAKRYPGVYLAEFETVLEEKRQIYKTVFREISEDAFVEALECLPPVGWVRQRHAESFKLSERLFDNITAVYCRLHTAGASRFFRFNDDIRTPHETIVERVMREMASLPAETPTAA